MVKVDAKHKVRVSLQNLDRGALRNPLFGEVNDQAEENLTRLKSHIRTVLSSDALARKSPSDDQAISEMPSE